MKQESQTGNRVKRLLRVLPFICVTLLSLGVAAGIGRERKPFTFNFSLATNDILKSLTKIAHFESTALILVLAILAVGLRRLRIAFVLTMLVCLGWELAEATAVGHTARLADLAPDLVAAVVGVMIFVLARYLGNQFTRLRVLAGLE